MIYPMFAMILLIMGYAGFTLYTRVTHVRSGQVHVKYFRSMSDTDVPDRIQVTTRHFSNLCETPPLFFIAGGILIALGIESPAAEFIGWLYVAARMVQMLIHNSYNNVLHRMLAFFLSMGCILGLWVIVLLYAG